MNPHQAPNIMEATISCGAGQPSLDAIRQSLFTNAMNGDWDKVIKTYKEEPAAHQVPITKSEDTAIHVAIAHSKQSIVQDLVSCVESVHLELKNERGNTPLHQAAILGNVNMCECIAMKNPTRLMGITNKDTETPFFLAVLHGRKEAFLCLHSLCQNGLGYNYSRRKKDGDTILHVAINGEYYEIAFEIITHYGNLINFRNEQGMLPLHLLAKNPTAFRSGSDITGFRKLIYDRITVDDSRILTAHDRRIHVAPYNRHEAIYPENYHTCAAFIHLFLRNIIRTLSGKSRPHGDTENPIEKLTKAEGQQSYPENYRTCFDFLKLSSKIVMIILGFGFGGIQEIQMEKEKHVRSVQILKRLLESASGSEYEYEDEDTGNRPPFPLRLFADDEGTTTPYGFIDGGEVTFGDENSFFSNTENDDDDHPVNNSSTETKTIMETPILMAAKNGVCEMVKLILDHFPTAIYDMNTMKKNAVLLAVENRQPDVYQYLLEKVDDALGNVIFHQTDKDGNSALHLAAMIADKEPGGILGPASKMQWEIQWYKFVKSSKPPDFFVRYNKESKTPQDIFAEKHKKMVEASREQLMGVSQACSAVAGIIAAVAFAVPSTLPGGAKEDNGAPKLGNQSTFIIFTVASFIAMCSSITSIMLFMAILLSGSRKHDFLRSLPNKFMLGMVFLLMAVASMLASFCAGHYFMLKHEWKSHAFVVYSIAFWPLMLFALAQINLFHDFWANTYAKVPTKIYP